MERIGIGPRFAAVLIDVVILVVGGAVITSVVAGGSVVAAFSMGRTEEAAAAGAVGGVLLAMIANSILALCYGLTEIFFAATPGKMALKLRIRNEDGTPAPRPVLARRWLVKHLSLILKLLYGVTAASVVLTVSNIVGLLVFLGFFLVLTSSRQAVHDRIAKTAVYRVG